MKIKELIQNPKVDFVISSIDRSPWVWITDKLDKSKRIRIKTHHDDFHIDMGITPAVYYVSTGKTVVIPKEWLDKVNWKSKVPDFPIVFVKGD